MCNINKTTLPIESLYEGRDNFSIVALTGIAGAGCSYLAKNMSSTNFLDSENIRKPQNLELKKVNSSYNSDIYHTKEIEKNEEAISCLNFYRKYTICYNFAKEYYKPYTIIKYTNVIWLYVLLYIIKGQKKTIKKDFFQIFHLILNDKYSLSHKNTDEQYKKKYNSKYNDDLKQEIEEIDFETLIKKIDDIQFEFDKLLFIKGEEVKNLANFFFESSEFNKFLSLVNQKLAKYDYFCLCRLYHRLATVIRATGDPTISSSSLVVEKNNCSHLYDLVRLINVLIKGYRANHENESCNIVIDSIRNSMEALYLKERFTAFYFVAIHATDENARKEFLREKIEKKVASNDRINDLLERVDFLSSREADNEDYENGFFASPNISQCIADAEIHILNVKKRKEKNEEETTNSDFHTLEEQWMKYATLILHPGLITPTTEERCMAVAFTAKLNSGCLSRQVGAVITNQYHSIRSIGWNDVAYGQISCALRDIKYLLKHGLEDGKCEVEYLFSDFERDGENKYDEKSKSFKDKIEEDYKDGIEYVEQKIKGLPFSYCFKTLENRYSGDKNQVFTRSLHAEENAMLQMVKYGGESLMNGVIYVTASPCELCSKKLYQIGIRRIVYIDPYPGIAPDQILKCGYKVPELKLFQGVCGASYFKLYQAFMPYKDELEIRTDKKAHVLHSSSELFAKLMTQIHMPIKGTYTDDELKEFETSISSIYKEECK